MSLTSKPSPAQIKRVPKVLLHDHLDGGLRPQTIIDIAQEIGYTALPTHDALELATWFRESCDSGSLVRYLETFSHTIAVMQRREDIIRVARECALDLARDGVVYYTLSLHDWSSDVCSSDLATSSRTNYGLRASR